MEVMQTLGLKILSLHEKDHSKGSTDGEAVSSSTPAAPVEEQGYEPTDDPVLQQIYENDALTRAQREKSLDDVIAQMDEEHKAFHDAIDQGIQRSIAAKAARERSEPTPTLFSDLPVERAEKVVAKYVQETISPKCIQDWPSEWRMRGPSKQELCQSSLGTVENPQDWPSEVFCSSNSSWPFGTWSRDSFRRIFCVKAQKVDNNTSGTCQENGVSRQLPTN
eukprot:2501529-Amphidinium_carterae.1